MEEGGAPVSYNRPQASAFPADALAAPWCLESIDCSARTLRLIPYHLLEAPCTPTPPP